MTRLPPHLARLLSSLLASSCLLAQPANLLPNGSFENQSLAGWSGTAGVTCTTNDAHLGSWSARLTSQTLSTTVSLPQNQPAKFTAWLRITQTTGTDSGWGGFRLEVLSHDWQSLAHSGWILQRTHGSQWLKLALPFTPTTPQTRLQIGYFGDPNRQMITLIDHLQVFTRPTTNSPPSVHAALNPSSFNTLPASQSFSLQTDDPDGAIQRVHWQFGDGTSSTSPNGERRIGVPGDCIARVRVADDDGAVTELQLPWHASDPRFPGLLITSPAEDTSTNTTGIAQLTGTTSENTTILISSDRGLLTPATNANPWSIPSPLQPGWNRLLVQARNPEGLLTTRERLIRYLPSSPLAIPTTTANPNPVPRWTTVEITATLAHSAATHPQFPHQPQPAPGLEWIDGLTLDGLFTPDNWHTVLRRPGFLQQRYTRALKGGEEWLYPNQDPVWTVRFAPPTPGTWRYRLEAAEARGHAASPEGSFVVTESHDPQNHGPILVSTTDPRYFEYADGTTFLGNGHNIGFSAERYSFDAEDEFAAMGDGNQQFFRWWIAGHLWGSAWQPWNSRTLGYNGTVPRTSLSLNAAYAHGLASASLHPANPIVFQGWMSGHTPLIPQRTYLARVRWRTDNVSGPASPGQPFGLCLKLTGWPEPGQTASLPSLIPHAHGDTPWHVASQSFVATTDLLPNLTLILENATGGTGYVDEVTLHELHPNGQSGPQLLRSPSFNSHLTFDPRRGAGIDAILRAAEQRNACFKLNISEKQEELLNWLGPDGLPDPRGGHFNRGPGSPTHHIHSSYWRHLLARFGASRAIHSWELVNEEDPNNLSHFRLANDLARHASQDGNPHPASTSTWASFASNSWHHPDTADLGLADFHAYARSTGELTPKDDLANDSARLFHEYDLAARAQLPPKPVVWGEMGIDGTNGSDHQDPLLAQDTNGVWLHKIVWARTGPGGVYPLYWYTDNITRHSLHYRYGAWNRFMQGIPLHNGRHLTAPATSTHPDLRILGQLDPLTLRAHLWLDNRHHTWRAVVAHSNLPPITATIALPLQTTHTPFLLRWFNTSTGHPTHTQNLTTDSQGQLLFQINNLTTDTALQLQPANPTPIPPRIHTFQHHHDSLHLAWHAERDHSYTILHRDTLEPFPWTTSATDLTPPGTRGEFWSPPGPASSHFYLLQAFLP